MNFDGEIEAIINGLNQLEYVAGGGKLTTGKSLKEKGKSAEHFNTNTSRTGLEMVEDVSVWWGKGKIIEGKMGLLI